MKHYLFLFAFVAIVLWQILFTVLVAGPPVEVVPVRLTADSENQGYEVFRAMDGDTTTMWHTQFSAPPQTDGSPFPIACGYKYGCNEYHPKPQIHPNSAGLATGNRDNNAPLPHFLMIDLGGSYSLTGFTYQARAGAANGTIGQYECFVTANELEQCSAVAAGTFTKTDKPQTVTFAAPQTGQYVKLVALTEVNRQPFTSVAELTLHCDRGNVRFVAKRDLQSEKSSLAPIPYSSAPKIAARHGVSDILAKEWIDQFNLIVVEMGKPAYYQAIVDQVADIQSLILETDRDPVSVVLRRTEAVLEELAAENGDLATEKLAVLHKLAEETPVADVEKRFDIFVQTCRLRRAIMLANPLMTTFDKLLFVKKHRATFDHLCDQFYGINLVHDSKGGLYTVDWRAAAAELEEVAAGNVTDNRILTNILAESVVKNGRLAGKKLDTGAFVTPDLSFDGTEIVFAFTDAEGSREHVFHHDLSRGHWSQGRSLHIFKCNSDGTDLTMLTDGTWNDFDPCFLPNGRIAFVSERRGGYLRCGRECPNYTLFDMNPDGSKMRCLSYHETNEWGPSVTGDGKIIWTRWDYVDRFGCVAHHPWLTSLDGRDPRSVHGNYSPRHLRADAEFDVRAISHSSKYIATAGPHHGQSFGSIILIDPQIEDDDAMAPVKRLTPDVGFPESQGGGEVYGTPWPLSETWFLAVADFGFQPGGGVERTGRGNYGIYLCDSRGNRELLYRDPTISCATPIPFIPRQTPPISPELIPIEDISHQPYVALPPFDGPRPQATIAITDVYQIDRPLPENTKITGLRVVQIYCMSEPSGSRRPHEIGFREPSSLDSINLTRSVLGTVPVEEDGSAYFHVPANMEIYFQLLDENGLAIHSMRSATALHPGETLSCVGCHEPQKGAPRPINRNPLALQRQPSELVRDVHGSRPVNFPQLVQPVLDRNCVECHREEIAKANPKNPKVLNLDRYPIQRQWYQSYNELVGKGFAFYSYGEPLRTNPATFGAKASKLYELLKDGDHYDVQLTSEDMYRLTLWMDTCSLFYGVYEKEGGEKQLRGEDAQPTLE